MALHFPRVALAAMVLCAAGSARAQITSRNMELLSHHDDYPPAPGARGYSSCWSYVHHDGREYAVLGTTHGTAIYNVTDPVASYRVAFVPGPSSIWRNVKSYRDWIYVVTEGVGPVPPPGVQIIRMTDPENPVLVATYAGTFIRSHTVSVDTARALLFCNGTRNAAGYQTGMGILSIADPESPVELASWPGGILAGTDSLYVHDSVPSGNRLYVSCVYAGRLHVLDIGDPSAPVEITAWGYPGGFTHNSWPDAEDRWLYVTDEVKGEPVKVFDIADIHAPVLVNAVTSNPEAVVHNVHVLGDELYFASFTEGVRVLDIADRAHPAEFAWADSWPGAEGPFYGVWEVCPFLPSGTVIASDMQSGLYVYRPVRDYGIVSVQAVDAATSLPIAGVRVRLATQGDSLITPADGMVRFAPSPGAHSVVARKFGYLDAAGGREVSAGSRDTLTLALVAKPAADLSGTVRDASSLVPIEDAEVRLPGTPLHRHTDALGRFVLEGVPHDEYRIEVRSPGFIPLAYERRIGPGLVPDQEYLLTPAATWDALESESGWTVGAPGDDAVSGIWTRVEPLGVGTSAAFFDPARAPGDGPRLSTRPSDRPPMPAHEGPGGAYPRRVQPDSDRTPGSGTMCFVTGQGTNVLDIWENEVSRGRTSLTSPPLDLSGMADPAIGYWRWFYSDGDDNDWLAVLVSDDDGGSWVAVDTLRGLRNQWEEGVIRVAEHVTPTARVRVRFVAADRGSDSIVEAAIDDLVTYDASIPAVGATVPGPPPRLSFRAPRPNPSGGTVRLDLETPSAGHVEVEVMDLQGRRIRTLYRGEAGAGVVALAWDGADESGRRAAAGLYFALATAAGASARARFVRIGLTER